MSNSTGLKDIKFTTCYRKTIFVYTETTFTEADFVKQLSDAGKEKWAALSAEERKKIWLKLKKDFPFETSAQNEWDPHTNWIEDWDTEESVEETEQWDYHQWVKETISTAVKEVATAALNS
jgi:hypothetical protein